MKPSVTNWREQVSRAGSTLLHFPLHRPICLCSRYQPSIGFERWVPGAGCERYLTPESCGISAEHHATWGELDTGGLTGMTRWATSRR